MAKQEYYDQADLAKLFGMTSQTIKNWRKSGAIPEPTKMIGSRAFWSKSELDKALRQTKKEIDRQRLNLGTNLTKFVECMEFAENTEVEGK